MKVTCSIVALDRDCQQITFNVSYGDPGPEYDFFPETGNCQRSSPMYGPYEDDRQELAEFVTAELDRLEGVGGKLDETAMTVRQWAKEWLTGKHYYFIDI